MQLRLPYNDVARGSEKESVKLCNKFPTARSSPSSSAKITLELAHTDIIVTFEVPLPGGFRYVITFVDDFSKCTVHYKMHHKSQTLDRLKIFKSYAKHKQRCALKHVHIHERSESKLSGSGTSINNFLLIKNAFAENTSTVRTLVSLKS